MTLSSNLALLNVSFTTIETPIVFPDIVHACLSDIDTPYIYSAHLYGVKYLVDSCHQLLKQHGNKPASRLLKAVLDGDEESQLLQEWRECQKEQLEYANYQLDRIPRRERPNTQHLREFQKEKILLEHMLTERHHPVTTPEFERLADLAWYTDMFLKYSGVTTPSF